MLLMQFFIYILNLIFCKFDFFKYFYIIPWFGKSMFSYTSTKEIYLIYIYVLNILSIFLFPQLYDKGLVQLNDLCWYLNCYQTKCFIQEYVQISIGCLNDATDYFLLSLTLLIKTFP